MKEIETAAAGWLKADSLGNKKLVARWNEVLMRRVRIFNSLYNYCVCCRLYVRTRPPSTRNALPGREVHDR